MILRKLLLADAEQSSLDVHVVIEPQIERCVSKEKKAFQLEQK
jgi:hypothetical protein